MREAGSFLRHDEEGFKAFLALEFDGNEEKYRRMTESWGDYTWETPAGGWLIYGFGGYHRFYVREDGIVDYSRSHGGAAAAEQAAALGFRIC